MNWNFFPSLNWIFDRNNEVSSLNNWFVVVKSPHSILQNQGKTAVLPVLPPMAPLPLVLEVPQSDVKRVQLVKGSHVKE